MYASKNGAAENIINLFSRSKPMSILFIGKQANRKPKHKRKTFQKARP